MNLNMLKYVLNMFKFFEQLEYVFKITSQFSSDFT